MPKGFTFQSWKKRIGVGYVAKSHSDLDSWLNLHGVNKLPEQIAQHNRWACKKLPNGSLLLQRYKIQMYVKGFDQPYQQTVVSLRTPKAIVDGVYFNIFGNSCKINSTDCRVIDWVIDTKMVVRKSTITAYVEAQNRSTIIVSNFLYHAKKRGKYWSLSTTKAQRHRSFEKSKISQKTEARRSFSDLTRQYRWSTDLYHKNLVQYFVMGKTQYVERPRLVLMFGIPGSGKNWVLNKRPKKDHVNINMDDCLAMLPHYWRLRIELQEKDKVAYDWIKIFRAECRSIALRLFRYAIEHGMNTIWNGTGKNMQKYLSLIDSARKKGYTIELIGVYVSLSIARERVRTRRTSIGRSVPDDIVVQAAKRVPHSFKALSILAVHATI